MVSVVILTKNEERDLARCLESLKWSNDVHVLDSGSVDQTIKIALDYNAKVSKHKFESFGQQRNFALEHIDFKNEWILFLDADEVVTKEFKEDLISSILEADDETVGFYCCWKMMLEDRWLKYCDNFPKWQFRVLKKGKAEFTDFGHGQKEGRVDGKLEYIKEPYLHYSFSKGWTQWIERHNKYSSQEAEARLDNCPPFRNIFNKHSSTRNPALKSWLIKVPGWPLLRFLHAYFFNLGFLEGSPGFIYCTNMAYHEFLISIKMRELKRKKRQVELKTI
ncbi:glycosyltransferase involved in cell wall biosynthesis [Christiangramia gaetbulicola]|uniref:Glycosyltransferase involved in cell wall biosynthesis n=1 Tax=Christiangramia gaetbulicola TaxID=703340 RepID=A0A2T6ANF3_9FLAO|nr:glycosyltransferase family 2 protein [Christiangramia gaetbulicola]PTX45343.1 glycosyltransferase involved in cell wall biosynthesis [Christiangramia gaetbulicola]